MESTWPTFIAAPFICPSCVTSSSATFSAHSPRACSARSGVRTVLAARLPSQRAPCPATSPPNFAVRPTREVGIRGITSRYGPRTAAGHTVGRSMPAPLLAVDGPSLLYRAFFALPQSITDADGRPVNALLGVANLVLQVARARRARAPSCCASAPRRRTTASSSTRPTTPTARRCPTSSCTSGRTCPRSSARSAGTLEEHGELEADDLLGSLATVESAAGGATLLFTGDRDMFQCVDDRTTVLFPAGRGARGPEAIGAERGAQPLRRRAGAGARLHRAARRPVRRPARRAGDRREDRARAAAARSARSTPSWPRRPTGPCAAACARAWPRPCATQADELRTFREIATLRHVDVPRPPDAPDGRRRRGGRGARARHAAPRERGSRRSATVREPPAGREAR